MPDHRLSPLTALGGTAPRVDRYSGVTVAENPDLALASVACRRGRAEDFRASTRALFGFDMPVPAQSAAAGDWRAFWVSPDQWMVEAPFASHEDIARIIKTALGDCASVTEQTDAWVRFDVSGPRTPDFFERLTGVDVRRMQAGAAQRTMMEHLGCYLVCRAPQSEFVILGPRSSAASLHHALAQAAEVIA